MKQWYETIFENYGNKYEEESYTKGSKGECDFIEREIGFDKTLHIIDIGCGTGRHCIELASRGYRITGVDLSESMLRKSREKALSLNLNIDFILKDARHLDYYNEFDVALMLCEGAFPLMETDEMNFDILKGITTALKRGGKLIFTTLNGLFPLFNSVQDFCSSTSEKGNMTYSQNSFDLMTFRDYNVTTFIDDNGFERQIECNERYYVPSEITWLLKSLGYAKIDIYGAKLGAFSREDKLGTTDFEMLVIGVKH